MSSSVAAEALPHLESIMTPKERQLFSDAIQNQAGKFQSADHPDISVLDGMLAKDPEPTPFRGYLQMLRSAILMASNRGDEAKAAADESVRLLPGYSGPLLQAFDVYAYSDRPGDGADYLLRASELDPDAVKKIDDYDIGNLIHRLAANREEKRLDAVAAKLLAIGWTGEQIDSRSDLASYAMKYRVSNGDLAGARALIPELIVPAETYAFLADNRYRELWPDLEKWAGPRLERQWTVYLDESRARYSASKDVEHLLPYVTALESAGQDDLVISETLPLYDGKLDLIADQDLITVAVHLGDALSRSGRWDDLYHVFDRAEQVWSSDVDANGLNLIANRARFLLYQDKPDQAVAVMDQAIEKAKKWGAQVNSDAVSEMHLYRACALHRLGRDADAAVSVAAAMQLADVGSLVDLYLCLGREDAARSTIIKAFAQEDSRSSAIRMLQVPSKAPCKSNYCAEMLERWTRLRADPQILAELRKYGRVMPFRLNEAAHFSVGTKTPQAVVPVT